MQDETATLNGRLTTSFNASLAEWQARLTAYPDVATSINDRLNALNTSFASAANNLKAAGDLEAKAQAIYSNDNINNMKDQLAAK